ncbi:VanZ family protein [Candidatus Oscillochloris fontis]|uniref:VanZ family protein n=1 Tax=Candidatus Oscillochloris fontis TaxID=2496868 RepID=UPI00101B72C5|nr:VanZ family protein [Candidatus Oscillochloris fontis]
MPRDTLFVRLANYWAVPLVVASLLVVLLGTLYPFTMQWELISNADKSEVLRTFLFRRSGGGDIVDNVLLFIPLGFGLASAKLVRRIPAWPLLVMLACTGLSTSVEFLQIALPSRAPTAMDVLTNTLGGGLGVFAFLVAQLLCFQRLSFAFVVSVATVGLFALTIPLQRTARLTNWEYPFTLNLGSQEQKWRAWTGTIRTLAFSPVAASPEELQVLTSQPTADPSYPWNAHYDLAASNPLEDQTGTQASFSPLRMAAINAGPEGVQFGVGQALTINSDGLAPIISPIQVADQITMVIALTPGKRDQYGQIMRIGDAENYLNLMLTQRGGDLIVQLRTPATGEHTDRMISLVLDHVFDQPGAQVIGLRYQRGVLQAAINGTLRPERLDITPAMAFFSLMLPFKANNVLTRYDWFPTLYALLYATMLFVPVGLASALWASPRWHLSLRRLLELSLALLAVGAYAWLTNYAGGHWSSPELALFQVGVALTTAGISGVMIGRDPPA